MDITTMDNIIILQNDKIFLNNKEIYFCECVAYCKLHPEEYKVEENIFEDIYIIDDDLNNVVIEKKICTKITIL